MENYYISPLNSRDEVRAEMNFHKKIKIADCTLRDGEQQSGVVFTKEEKLEIALQLDRLGVHELELGTLAVSREDVEAAELIVNSRIKAKTTTLCRCKEEDIDLVSNVGIWGALISLPIGVMQMMYKLKITEEQFLNTARKYTEYARKKGLFVVFSPYDTTRADLPFLEKVLTTLAKDGTIDRVRLVDTVGAASPEGIKFLTRFMVERLNGIPVEVHCHDDFGLAVANTLAALSSGAQVASTTVNGIGERSGNTPTEELILSLKLLYGIDLGLNIGELKKTSEMVEKLSGIRLQTNKAVVGQTSFTHESGMVVAGLLNMPFVAEPYRPEIVGQTRKIVVGKKSGLKSLQEKLRLLNIQMSEEQANELLGKVKELAIKKKTYVTDQELLDLSQQR